MNNYLVNASINSAFFKEVYPEIPSSFAKSLNSATVNAFKSSEATASAALGSAFVAAAFFTAPLAAILSIWISVKD